MNSNLTTNQVRKSLFLLRSWYEQGPSGGECERSGQRGSRQDHQGKVSVFATRRSSTRGNYQGGPGSAARVGIVRASPQTPRPMPRCARASAAPKGSPDWPSAGPTSAGWRNASLRLIEQKQPASTSHERRVSPKGPRNLKGTYVPASVSESFLIFFEKSDREKQLAKIKFSCTDVYVHGFHVLTSTYAVKNRS